MKVVSKEINIPAQIITKTMYIANDGAEFYSEAECLHHECMKHPLFQNAIRGKISTYPEDYSADLYYISNDEEFQIFLGAQDLQEWEPLFHSDYREYGPGWYIWRYDSIKNKYIFLNLNNYIHEAKNDFSIWLNKIETAIGGK